MLLLVASGLSLMTVAGSFAQTPTIDLTAVPKVESTSASFSTRDGLIVSSPSPLGFLQLSGDFQYRLYSGLQNGVGDPRYSLPLAVELRSITPGQRGGHIAEVVLRNTGPSTFFLPVSRDQTRSSVLPGNMNRRLFLFQVKLKVQGQPDVLSHVTTTDGSDTKPDSLFPLRSQEAITIRYPIVFTDIKQGTVKLGSGIPAQALLTEWKLPDDKNVINDVSKALESANTLSIQLQP